MYYDDYIYIYLFYVDISELWSQSEISKQKAFIDSIYSVQLSALQWRVLLWYAFHNDVEEFPFWHWQIIFLSRSVCVFSVDLDSEIRTHFLPIGITQLRE